MLKVFSPSSWNFGEALAVPIKLSYRGLRGHDYGVLEKRAGREFVEQIKHAHWSPGEVPVHLIAMGATEVTGPNRNSDGWRTKVLRDTHDSFVKDAMPFRDHNNKKSKDPSIGRVGLSHYNEDMGRVELAVALNETKEAAQRNGGDLGRVADVELEKLAKDEMVPVSMSVLVPFDICHGCGNKARSRAEYCLGDHEGGQCKYGGLRHNIGKIAADGLRLHADNPPGKFFDISFLSGRQADPTAYALGIIEKAAAAEGIVCGAELAERLGITAPPELLAAIRGGILMDPNVVRLTKLAVELSDLERLNQLNFPTDQTLALGLPSLTGLGCQLDAGMPKYARTSVMGLFAAHNATLPIADFLNLYTSRSENDLQHCVEKVAACLPGIYTRLIADPNFDRKLQQCEHPRAAQNDIRNDHVLVKQARDYSIHPGLVRSRMLHGMVEKRASLHRPMLTKAADSATEGMAQAYAIYRLHALDDWRSRGEDPHGSLADLLVRQHYLC
jgi:hypothetical protein